MDGDKLMCRSQLAGDQTERKIRGAQAGRTCDRE